jgi:hypothetical protein
VKEIKVEEAVKHEDNVWGITLEGSSEAPETTQPPSNLPEGLKYAYDQPVDTKVC